MATGQERSFARGQRHEDVTEAPQGRAVFPSDVRVNFWAADGVTDALGTISCAIKRLSSGNTADCQPRATAPATCAGRAMHCSRVNLVQLPGGVVPAQDVRVKMLSDFWSEVLVVRAKYLPNRCQ